MKKVFLLMVIFALVVGCAKVPIRNIEFTKSNLPKQYSIEGVKTIKIGDVEPIKGNFGTFFGGPYWMACIDTVLNFYGRPLGKDTIDKAIAKVRTGKPAGEVISAPLILAPVVAISAGRSTIVPIEYYPTALQLNGFKLYSFSDLSVDGTKIKFFIAQGHPVMVAHNSDPLASYTSPIDGQSGGENLL